MLSFKRDALCYRNDLGLHPLVRCVSAELLTLPLNNGRTQRVGRLFGDHQMGDPILAAS